jgi:flagellar biosynthetic protein FlhB
MSEERSQPPSQRKRQWAREHGLVAFSPELTAALALLALSFAFPAACHSLLKLTRDRLIASLQSEPWLAPDASGLIQNIQSFACAAATPFLWIAAIGLCSSILAHQLQLGGFWQPNLLAIEARRLWMNDASVDVPQRLSRASWGSLKLVLVLGLAFVFLFLHRETLAHMPRADWPSALLVGGELVASALRTLALGCLALGAIDFTSRFFRVENLLRMTPEEQREELKTVEGNPEVRSRQRRHARRWRSDLRELPRDLALALIGPGPTLVLIAGNPPPGKIQVRGVLHGIEATLLIRTIHEAGIPIHQEPDLARALDRPARARQGLSPPLAARLAQIWPSRPA